VTTADSRPARCDLLTFLHYKRHIHAGDQHKKATIGMSSLHDGAGEAAPALAWRKSSFCASGECVEITARDGMVLIRDSKAPQSGVLTYSADEFRSFVRGVMAGEFSDLCGL
jgi:hypothetical protein